MCIFLAQSWTLQMCSLRELSFANVSFMTAEHGDCKFKVLSLANVNFIRPSFVIENFMLAELCRYKNL